MVLEARGRPGAGMGRGRIAAFAIAAALLCGAGFDSAVAQGTMNDALTRRVQAGEGKDRLLLEAKEIVYDNDNNTVSAVGDVELYYQGRTLQADRVDLRPQERPGVRGGQRPDGRRERRGHHRRPVRAHRRLQERLHRFAAGRADGRPARPRQSRPISRRPAPSASKASQTVFERGTYTACEPCKEHPERPPLWQVKAARIIHNNEERMIYYENATLELYGYPIAYMPYFWSPDPTVKRKTGFLAPHYIASSSLGTGVAIPFFWDVAPNMDLTLQPTFLSRQGVLGQAEWRHRLLTGTYNIRARRHLPARRHGVPAAAARRPGPRFPRLVRVHRALQHQRELALGLGRRGALGQVVPGELPHQEREHPDALRQGVDLDALPAGPGRPLLVRRPRLLLQGTVELRLAEAAARRAPGHRLREARRRPAPARRRDGVQRST